MITIDMNKVMAVLPSATSVEISLRPSVKLVFKTQHSMSPEQYKEVKAALREELGNTNILEIYTYTEGTYWVIYLKRQQIEFLNCTNINIG